MFVIIMPILKIKSLKYGKLKYLNLWQTINSKDKLNLRIYITSVK